MTLDRSPISVATRRTPYRILIVDDFPDNIALMRAYLSDCQFELDYAENGQIALEKFISNQPDLVIMDLQMPVMNGLEATRAIRRWEALNKTAKIPILAWTASGVMVGESFAAGCDEHLKKPITCSALLDALSRHLG